MLKATVNQKRTYEIDSAPVKTQVDGQAFNYDLTPLSDRHFHLIHKDQSYQMEVIAVNHSRKEYTIRVNGKKMHVKLQDRFDQLIESLGMQDEEEQGGKNILAPMPGLVLEIHVEAGTEVKKGEPLITLEAMKMENVLKAPADGKVDKVLVETGKSVEKNYLLLKIE